MVILYNMLYILCNMYNFNIISAWPNTVNCFYRAPPDDEQLFVRNLSRMARPQVANGGTASNMEGSCE